MTNENKHWDLQPSSQQSVWDLLSLPILLLTVSLDFWLFNSSPTLALCFLLELECRSWCPWYWSLFSLGNSFFLILLLSCPKPLAWAPAQPASSPWTTLMPHVGWACSASHCHLEGSFDGVEHVCFPLDCNYSRAQWCPVYMVSFPLLALHLVQSKGSASIYWFPVTESALGLSLRETSIRTVTLGIYHEDTWVNRNFRMLERLLDKLEITGKRDAIFSPIPIINDLTKSVAHGSSMTFPLWIVAFLLLLKISPLLVQLIFSQLDCTFPRPLDSCLV